MKELNPPFEFRGRLYKVCNICNKRKPIERFSKSSIKKSGYRGDCKDCCRETRNKYKKEYNADYEKNRKLKRVYGISLKDFNSMLISQDFKCGICGKEIDGTKSTHVDHCHNTGKVRELLCSKCNQGLGQVNESIDILKSMIQYLNKHDEAK